MRELFKPSITDVYEYYDLRIIGTRGAWRKAECPMPDHEDANPSASVNEDLGKWHCWSCDSKGDVLDIIGKREDIAGVIDVERFAKSKFEYRDDGISGEPGPGSELLGGARGKRSGRHFVPAWRRV